MVKQRYIIHCIHSKEWDNVKSGNYYHPSSIERQGFIHCSDFDTFQKVVPNFKQKKDPFLILILDTKKINVPIKWEDLDNVGTSYPHIYGELNLHAIVNVLPFLRDNNLEYYPNTEFIDYLNKD